MGNWGSKKSKNLDEDVDGNKDGIITRKEFDSWVKHFEREITSKNSKKKEELTKTKQKVVELEKQIEALIKLNDDLNKQTQQIQQTNTTVKAKKDLSQENELSQLRIEEMVEELLANQNINIKYFPDWVEKQLYRNVISLVMNLMDSVLDQTNIDFMGHQITFDLHPLSNDSNDSNDMQNDKN